MFLTDLRTSPFIIQRILEVLHLIKPIISMFYSHPKSMDKINCIHYANNVSVMLQLRASSVVGDQR
jgi:hypothetical protein